MEQSATDLRQLKGIGKILDKRLHDAGLDSIAKIALTGEEELKKISGINQRNVSSLLGQAKRLAEAAHTDKLAAIEALQQRLSEVKEKIRTLAESTRDRFQEELAGKWGKKLASDLVRIEDTLEGINLEGKKGARRAGKALKKVDRRVSELAGDASLKAVHKTLKRARKTVKKAGK